MPLKVLNLKPEKKQYLYGIDKSVKVSFKLKLEGSKGITVNRLYAEYSTIGSCNGSSSSISSEIVELDSNLHMNGYDDKEYIFSFPINLPSISGKEIKIENFLSIKSEPSKLKHKVKINIPYKSSSYKQYGINNIVDSKFISDLKIKNHFSETHDIFGEKIAGKGGEFFDSDNYHKVNISKRFQGLFRFGIFGIIYKDDYVDKYIYDKALKDSFFIRFIDGLLNSKNYQLIYFISIFPFFIFLALSFLEPKVILFKLLSLFFILLIIFSKISELFYKVLINKYFFDIRFNGSSRVSGLVNKGFKNGILYFSDIFETFKLRGFSNGLSYLFSLRIDTYLLYKYSSGNDSIIKREAVSGIELLNNKSTNLLNVSSVNLLEGLGSDINKVLLPVFDVKPYGTHCKLYHKMVFNFISPLLPNFERSVNIDIDKVLNVDKDNTKALRIMFNVVVIILALIFVVYQELGPEVFLNFIKEHL